MIIIHVRPTGPKEAAAFADAFAKWAATPAVAQLLRDGENAWRLTLSESRDAPKKRAKP